MRTTLNGLCQDRWAPVRGVHAGFTITYRDTGIRVRLADLIKFRV